MVGRGVSTVSPRSLEVNNNSGVGGNDITMKIAAQYRVAAAPHHKSCIPRTLLPLALLELVVVEVRGGPSCFQYLLVQPLTVNVTVITWLVCEEDETVAPFRHVTEFALSQRVFLVCEP